MAAALILVFLFVLYLLMLRGRTGHKDLPEFSHYAYAHRGLYGGAIPENSLAAFQSAFNAGFGIEFDLHLLKDGNIGILHDSSLMRMTGKEGYLEDLTTEALSSCHLHGTPETIPTFSQVLSLCGGRVPLIIELKSFHGNGDRLAETACRMLEGYQGLYCLESFDPRCVRWLKENRPDLIRGQLSENFIKNDAYPIPWVLRFLAACQLETFWTRPDFIAHKFEDRRTLSNFLIRRLWRIQGVTWTVKSQEEYDQALKEGWIPIFEGFVPDKKPNTDTR